MYVATLTLVWWWQIILIRSGGGVNFFVQFLLQYTQTENVPTFKLTTPPFEYHNYKTDVKVLIIDIKLQFSSDKVAII